MKIYSTFLSTYLNNITYFHNGNIKFKQTSFTKRLFDIKTKLLKYVNSVIHLQVHIKKKTEFKIIVVIYNFIIIENGFPQNFYFLNGFYFVGLRYNYYIVKSHVVSWEKNNLNRYENNV